MAWYSLQPKMYSPGAGKDTQVITGRGFNPPSTDTSTIVGSGNLEKDEFSVFLYSPPDDFSYMKDEVVQSR